MSTGIRTVIKTNLEQWMRERPDLDTQMKVSAASGVGQTTVGRILNRKVAATVDLIDDIARAFGRDPGDLLRSQINASINYDRRRYGKLPDYERVRIEGFIKHVLAEYSSGSGPLSFEEVKRIPEKEVIKAAAQRSPRRGLSVKAKKTHDPIPKGAAKKRRPT